MTQQEVLNRALELATPCKCCKRLPKLVVFSGDIYYAQCDCKKWVEWPYIFCGTTPKGAINHWNLYQKHGALPEEF